MAGDVVPPPPPPKIESNSPYFLGPQDRPGDYITPTRFKGASNNAAIGQHFTSEQWKAITGFFGNATIPENRLNGKVMFFLGLLTLVLLIMLPVSNRGCLMSILFIVLLVCLMVKRCLLLWKVLFECQIKSPYIMSFMCLIYVATYSPSPNLLIIYILLSLLSLICVLFRTH